MSNKPAGLPVQVTLHTEDPLLAQAVNEYWQLDDEYRFVKSVAGIQKQFQDLWPKGDYLNHIRGAATVFLRDVPCPECGSEIAVGSRRDVLNLAKALTVEGHPDVRCTTCQGSVVAAQAAAVLQARQARSVSEAHLRGQLAAMIARYESPESWPDYAQLPFEIAIKLCALDAWSGFALADGSAPPPQGEGRITPLRGDDFTLLSALYAARVISPRPVNEQSPGTGFAFDPEGRISWWWDKVRSALQPHLTGSTRDALTLAASRNPDSVEDVLKVWREVSIATCMSYLYSQLDQNSLRYPEAPEIEECERVIAGAIQVYSVSQTWSVIWRVVREAAALCSRPYYTSRTAAKTIPGKLDRAFMAARAANRELPLYDRTPDNPVSELELQLLDRFGISEYTAPQALSALVLPHIRKQESGRFSPPEFDEAVRALLGAETYAAIQGADEAIKLIAYRVFLAPPLPEQAPHVDVVQAIALERNAASSNTRTSE